jgi:adenylate cyclase
MLEAGTVSLKGKSRPTKVLALVGDAAMAESADFQALALAHGQLTDALAACDAAAATLALRACRAIAPAHLTTFYGWFEQQIRGFAHPPVSRAAE